MPAPIHTIDLTLAPEDRFRAFGIENRATIRKLMARTRREAEKLGPASILETLLGAVSRLYRGHEYVRELEGLADAVGTDVESLYVINLAYDVASVTHNFTNRYNALIGCTGMIHAGPPHPMIARNMDWTFPTKVGEDSCIFRFVRGEHAYLSVGFPGVTGVVSGLSNAGFALTVNQAPHTSLPSLALPMLWLTRTVMDQATSFKSARRILASNAAATSAYLLLAGRDPGEAVRIVSRGKSDDVLVLSPGEYAVAANHEPGDEEDNDYEEGDSFHRYCALDARGAKVSGADVASARKALSRWPVFNGDTVHQMVLTPGRGELHLRCPHRNERSYTRYTLEP